MFDPCWDNLDSHKDVNYDHPGERSPEKDSLR